MTGGPREEQWKERLKSVPKQPNASNQTCPKWCLKLYKRCWLPVKANGWLHKLTSNLEHLPASDSCLILPQDFAAFRLIQNPAIHQTHVSLAGLSAVCPFCLIPGLHNMPLEQDLCIYYSESWLCLNSRWQLWFLQAHPVACTAGTLLCSVALPPFIMNGSCAVLPNWMWMSLKFKCMQGPSGTPEAYFS